MVAPFAFWLLLLAVIPTTARADACPAQHIDERVRVVHVFDGDTFKLTDGRRVRIIGINTPELRPDGPATEPFADQAKAALQSMIDRSNRTVLLQYGNEHTDHYGRVLAHAYLDGGRNIAAHLLLDGLATTLAVPPNTRMHDCYQRQEDIARVERRGIWDHPRYQVRDSRTLPAATRGFSLVYGRIADISRGGGTVWLDLDGPLKVRIAREDQLNFPGGQLEHLAGKTVEVRGWIRSRPTGLVMTVRHPAALSIISTDRQ